MDSEREAVAEYKPASESEYTTYSSGDQPNRGRRRGGFSAAILLIGVGVLFLLNNLGILHTDLFALVRFWPVLLILVGLDILVGRQSAVGSLITAGIAVLVIGGILVWASSGTTVTSERLVSGPISVELGDVSEAKVTLNLGTYKTTIRGLSGGSELAAGTFDSPRENDITVDYTARGGTGILEINQNDTRDQFPFWGPDTRNNIFGTMDLALTDQIPLDVIVNAGVSDLDIDLTGLNIRSLTIEGGVGEVTVILPDQGQITVKMDVGVGNVEVVIPESMEVRLTFDGGLGNFRTPPRLSKDGDYWQTEGYSSSAANRVDMDIDAGVGNVDIR